ncbi:hypothetical protein GCM10011581_02820 [Saccharopolyspora subtropica]|uniref:EccD-like transmembrane domain-containing protein n=1 Tax=Saccharopolyspora thermophila TaxID=89367 RepID=A0A917N639_9PSEU|nr:type VII secretion integral membrane protein EccD [Saccharopolyspora subtropica]GGI69264.1 hypothetical protein GCM10011581_02820 [Saccharopolyspora subtropica]
MNDATKDGTHQLCRLRLIIGSRALDMALPPDVALIDMLPGILRALGGKVADQGVEHEGWVLQRIGGTPLDETRTAEELGLLDGETIHVRPRAAALPPIDFDDLVAGIGEQTRTWDNRWSAERTRFMLLAFAAATFGLGALLLASGGLTPARMFTAAGAAVALVVTAAALNRALGDVVTATVLSLVAVPYAAIAGWLLPTVFGAQAPSSAFCAALFGTTALALGMIGVGAARLIHISGLVAGGQLTVITLIPAVTPATPAQAAGVGLLLCLVLTMFVPTASFRLAGLALPALPTRAEEFGQDIEPVPYRQVVHRSVVADHYMTALSATLGIVELGIFGVLVTSGGLWELTLTAVGGLLLLMRARNLDSMYQRWALLLPGGLAVFAVVWRAAVLVPPFERLVLVFVAILLIAVLLAVASLTLPGRQLRPYWGRALDIFDTACILAVIPILLAVLNVYALVRGLGG